MRLCRQKIATRHVIGGMLTAALVALFSAPVAQATLVYSGDIYPTSDPSTWTSSGGSSATTAYIGYMTGNGNLAIDGGSKVSARTAYLGNLAGLTGTVSVTGSGSAFNPRTLYVGNSGTGNISIANAGSVSTGSGAFLGYNAGSTGTVTVDGTGSGFYNSYPLYVGYSGTGSISVTNGGTLTSAPSIGAGAYLGYNTGSTGSVTIDGTGSKWTNTGSLIIGGSGAGTLNITNGSSVSATGTTTVGTQGVINFGANGGTLTTGSLYAGAPQLSGTGTITTSGIVGDMNIVFDASHGTSQSFAVNGVTLNLNLSSSGALGVGYLGSGTLGISGGVNIASNTGYLGYNTGSTGTATVTGSGSAWTNSGTLYVGNSGTGSLSVTNGGSVASSVAYLGYNTGSTGTVTVDGAGSKWTNSGTNSGNLTIGGSGTGTLNITNGSAVTATGVTTVGVLGTVNFGSSGGTLNTGLLNAASSQFSGTGTVITHGWLGDANLEFNGQGKSTLTLATWKGANQNVTVNLDLSGSGGIVGDLAVGYQNSGSLALKNGATATTGSAYIGYNAGSTGTATVTGPGSTWTIANVGPNGGAINVGSYGTGSLSVTNGGVVTGPSGTSLYIGRYAGSTGTVTVDGAGSQLNPGTAFIIGEFGTGTASIINGGSAHAQSVSVSNETTSGPGTLFVDGSGSTVLYNSSLYVGHMGNGRLYITNGGNVYGTNSTSYISVADWQSNNPFGMVVVDGTGSKLSTGATGVLTLGSNGTGVAKISISNGGTVTAGALSNYKGAMLTADLGKGSSLTVNGTLTNNGTIRLVAGATAADGTYTPVTAGIWAGTTGTVQALGGTWDAASHTVSVSGAVTGSTGNALTADLAATQRFLFTDGSTGKSVGAAFQGAAISTNLTLTASAISDSELNSLQSLLGSGQSVLSGWDFTTNGYTEGDPAYLTLFAGAGQSLAGLDIWHFDGTNWSLFDATDLAYDNTYASFTVNGLSGYAVTGNAPVPLPPAFYMFGTGLLGLAGMRRRILNL